MIFKRSGEHVQSKAVKKRLNATTVLSVMHHKYYLLGNIYDPKEELPEYIRHKFINGFPTDWENVREIWQSNITDLPVSHSTQTETLPKSPFSTTISNELATETATNRTRMEKKSSERRISEADVDVATVQSAGIENSSVRDKTIEALQTSCKNSVEQTSQTPVDVSKSHNPPSSTNSLSKAEETISQKFASTIPSWKIDIIVDNLKDKNCSNENIHTIIEAINCINELFTMSSTDVTQTASNEGVSVNDNNMENVNGSKDRNDSNFQSTKQTAAVKSCCSTLSLATSSESEPELPPKKNTFTCQEPARLRNNKTPNCKSPESLQSQVSSIAQIINPNHTDVMSNNLSESTLVRVTTPIHDGNHQNRKDNMSIPALPRVESPGKSSKNSRYNRKLIFDITDTDMDMAYQNNARTSLVNNNSYTSTKAFRRILATKHLSVTTEKIVNKGKGISRGDVDSNISIIDCYTGPCHKTTSVNTEKRTRGSSERNLQKETLDGIFEFGNNERNNHVQTGTRSPKDSEKSLDSSNPNVTPQIIGDSCAVRLTKINLDQHNAGLNNSDTPPRSDRIAPLQKRRKVDSGRENSEQSESDSEKFSMRMSSRGLRILPRLDNWSGGKVFLRDHTLNHSPGIPDTTFSSANSTIRRKLPISHNKTTVSEPPLPQSTAKKLNGTPKVSKEWSQFETEHRNKNALSNVGILSEMTENQEPTKNYIHRVAKRKRRKIY